MEQAGLEARFVQGRRYTDDATLEIVARVLAEEINADIVRHISKFGGRASGLHHKTSQCLFGTPADLLDGPDGTKIDLGRVGEVTEVDVPPIENLCLAGVVPVLPSLAEDDDGQLLNVNADTAAAAVAMALKADKLVFLTDTPGILRDRHEPGSLIRGLTPDDCRDLIARRGHRQGDDPQGRGLPRPASRPGSRRPTSSTAGSATRCSWKCTPTQGIGTEIVLQGERRGRRAPRAGRGQALTPRHRHGFDPSSGPLDDLPSLRHTAPAGPRRHQQREPLALDPAAHQSSAETIAQFGRYVIPNYRRYPVCLVRGEGSWVWDAEGHRYLDFFPGWGCNLLGHCPPRVVEAVREQVGQLIHVPNTWYMEAQGAFAQALSERSFGGQCFFCNSGAEANEAAIKLARLHGHAAGPIQDRHDGRRASTAGPTPR